MSLRGCCTWTATACMLSVPPMPASLTPSSGQHPLWMANKHFVLFDQSSLLALLCAKRNACFNMAHGAVYTSLLH